MSLITNKNVNSRQFLNNFYHKYFFELFFLNNP